eukprot:SAG22_NODE_809_length_7067_cov_5.261768_4_plen_310_part_00
MPSQLVVSLFALFALATAGKFDGFKDCSSCVAAGFGWSEAKQRCGGFANKECAPAASTGTAAASPAAAAAAAEPAGKWARLLALHEAAVAAHVGCKGIGCFRSVIDADLAPWNETGITRSIFERTRQYNMFDPVTKQPAGRMNHYQIIGGRLYRSDRCSSRSGRLSFHPRCEGIEHTLLELLAEDTRNKAAGKQRKGRPALPDVEFVLNVNDKPQMAGATAGGVCVGPDDKKKLCTREPLPLFSFSKPEGVDQIKSVTGVPVGGPFWDIMYPVGGPASQPVPGPVAILSACPASGGCDPGTPAAAPLAS